MPINPRRLALLVAAPLITATTFALAQTAPAPEAPVGPPAVRSTPAQFHGRHGGPDGGPGGGFGGRDLMRGLFGEIDADGDGSVTQAEIDAFRTAQLSAADANGDGRLALDEFATVYFERIRPQMVDAFQAFDDDGDGAITAAELEDRFGDVVSRLDRNGDGALSPDDRGRRGGDR